MKKGFTLIELLVVIAIIALLSTLSVVALNSARVKSRDARRVSDIKQIRTALEMYFDAKLEYPVNEELPLGSIDEGSYCLSESGFDSECSGTVFMQKVPGDPLASGSYVYTVGTNNDTYTITYKLEKNTSTSIATPVSMGE